MSLDASPENPGTPQNPPARWQEVPAIVSDAGEQASAAYLAFLGQAKWSPATRELYAQHARRFFRWALERGLTLESLGANEVALYASALAGMRSAQAVGIYVTSIQRMLRHLASAGVCFGNDLSVKATPGSTANADTAMKRQRLAIPGRYTIEIECADDLTSLERRELKVLLEREIFLLQREP
jgi:hypothetical protein